MTHMWRHINGICPSLTKKGGVKRNEKRQCSKIQCKIHTRKLSIPLTPPPQKKNFSSTSCVGFSEHHPPQPTQKSVLNTGNKSNSLVLKCLMSYILLSEAPHWNFSCANMSCFMHQWANHNLHINVLKYNYAPFWTLINSTECNWLKTQSITLAYPITPVPLAIIMKKHETKSRNPWKYMILYSTSKSLTTFGGKGGSNRISKKGKRISY